MHVILLCRVPPEVESVPDGRFPVSLAAGMPVASLPGAGDDRVEWVRTGWSEPWFPLLPDTEVTRQLEREATALAGLGAKAGPLWVTGPWATRLPLTFSRAGVEALLIPADQLDVPRAGVVAHLDAVLPVVPVFDFGSLSTIDLDPDEAVAVEVRWSELEQAVERVTGLAGCDLTSVSAYLGSHRPSGRRRPVVEDWEVRFEADPDLFVLHRKLVRLVTRVPDRLSAATEAAVLEAERPFTGDRIDRVNRAIVEARIAVDNERRRGDDWLNVSRLDWDADGAEEVHVELAGLSMVVAPHRSAAAPSVDLKSPVWPVSSVPGEPGWTLCHYTTDGEEPLPIELAVIRASEVRGGKAELELTGNLADGTVTLDLALSSTRLVLEFRCEGAPPGLVGPELKFAFSGETSLRVDGGTWLPITKPVAATGHKLRLSDGERQVVMSSLIPCSVFLRPGVDGNGLVAWAHWSTSGTDSHVITLDLAP